MQRDPDGLQEERRIEWLVQHVYCAALHCPLPQKSIIERGDEDDRNTEAAVVQAPLQLQAIDARHAEIQKQTAGFFERS